MKKILLFVLPVLLLTSCAQYDNGIHGTIVTPGGWQVATDGIGAKSTFQVQDTTYTVSPTWHQAWEWSGQRNDRVWFWVGLGILIAAFAVFIKLSNSGGAKGGAVIGLCIAILIGGSLIGGSLEWEKWNMDQSISKYLYDALMKNPGNLGPFWDTIRIK